ncbi:LysR substrate-binding domain-containing protein [Hyalangium versicolor]|uniref:LysR substrate-binding domain-containing protein n=1 Tax=Hyalangium versicolor TaxID=2861190 RepID=UPI001CCB0A9E|nr:LysR substrate-binding domain-containing protein [Hyalangium versicolor]
MTDRLSGVSAFVAVVEAGGFAAAAERLSLSRSAVGKTIARLEGRLGVRLFHRTTRSLSLTDDGHAFYERCVRALSELEAAEAALDSARREPTGRVRISVPVLLGRRCVAPVLMELASRHPGLEFDVSFTDRPVDLIEEGYDVVVRNGPLPDNTGLTARKLCSQRMTVCAAPSYLAARGRPRRLEDLVDHEAVVYGRAGKIRSWLFPDGHGGVRSPRLSTRIRMDDLEAVADAAVAGRGISWLPCWLISERVRSGALVLLLKDLPALSFETYALWPQSPHLPSRVRVVIDALAERLPRMMD